MEKKILMSEIQNFIWKTEKIFDKDPFRITNLENLNLYNNYVKKMKELFPDQRELQELTEIDPKKQEISNDELYILAGRLDCFIYLLKED